MTNKKFSTNAESTTTISFKELKNGDIFIGGPQQRIYMKMAEAHHTNYDGEQTTMNAVRLGTGCLAHFPMNTTLLFATTQRLNVSNSKTYQRAQALWYYWS